MKAVGGRGEVTGEERLAGYLGGVAGRPGQGQPIGPRPPPPCPPSLPPPPLPAAAVELGGDNPCSSACIACCGATDDPNRFVPPRLTPKVPAPVMRLDDRLEDEEAREEG